MRLAVLMPMPLVVRITAVYMMDYLCSYAERVGKRRPSAQTTSSLPSMPGAPRHGAFCMFRLPNAGYNFIKGIAQTRQRALLDKRAGAAQTESELPSNTT